METLLEKAKKVAETCHKGQVDRAGKPYMNHLLTVSNGVKDLGETYAVVGMLHDTVEDTEMTVEKLRELFGDEVAEAVGLLTHDDKGYIFYEAKFRKTPVTDAMIQTEIRQVQQTGMNCHRYGFFSRSGYQVTPRPGVILYTLEDLYSNG